LRTGLGSSSQPEDEIAALNIQVEDLRDALKDAEAQLRRN
jgi:hypothetical protein